MNDLTGTWIEQIVIMVILAFGVAVFLYMIWLAIKALRKYTKDQ
jgi:hypothetical protein